MRLRRILLQAAAIFLAGAAAQAQSTSAQAPAGSNTVIRAESRLVLVDTVVTDKKGNYVRDLEAKDFRVWEDNKEQTVTSFSFEADPASPRNSEKHYLVLFFDNSTMDFADQGRARQAAAKFIDSNTGPNRLIAVVNYGGSVRIAQNFTADTERMKQVVAGVKFFSRCFGIFMKRLRKAAARARSGFWCRSRIARFGWNSSRTRRNCSKK